MFINFVHEMHHVLELYMLFIYFLPLISYVFICLRMKVCPTRQSARLISCNQMRRLVNIFGSLSLFFVIIQRQKDNIWRDNVA